LDEQEGRRVAWDELMGTDEWCFTGRCHGRAAVASGRA
jgi:hypothetical protein